MLGGGPAEITEVNGVGLGLRLSYTMRTPASGAPKWDCMRSVRVSFRPHDVPRPTRTRTRMRTVAGVRGESGRGPGAWAWTADRQDQLGLVENTARANAPSALRPQALTHAHGLRWLASPIESPLKSCGFERRPGERHTSACRVQPHLLPAGGLLHLLPAGGLLHLLPAGAPLHLLPAGAPLHLQPAGAVASPAPTAGPSRFACQAGHYTQPSPSHARTPAKVAPLVGQKKTRHLPTATRPKPDRLDNPNRPVSILSNSEPALCALAPAPSLQAPPVPVPSPGFARSCRRPLVAAATPKTARQSPNLAVSPGENSRNGEPPPIHPFRHFPLLSADSPYPPLQHPRKKGPDHGGGRRRLPSEGVRRGGNPCGHGSRGGPTGWRSWIGGGQVRSVHLVLVSSLLIANCQRL